MQRKNLLAVCTAALLFTQSITAQTETNTVVLDSKNAIYWQDDVESEKSTEDWDDAIAYCQTLTRDGLTNWRLPTFRELLSIVNYGRKDIAVNTAFEHTNEGTYWTATDFSATRSRAWTIDFRTGKTFYSYKTTNHSVRCVADQNSSAKKDEK